MSENIFSQYLDYIKSIPEEQLINELVECGLEDYICDSPTEDYKLPEFVSVEKAIYTQKDLAAYCNSSDISTKGIIINSSLIDSQFYLKCA